MKKTLKKVMASVVAVASLAMGITGISASAYWGSGTFNDGISSVEKYLSVSSTSLYAYTSSDYTTSKYVEIDGYNSNSGSTTKITTQYWGSGFTNASSTHSSNNSANSYLTVWA